MIQGESASTSGSTENKRVKRSRRKVKKTTSSAPTTSEKTEVKPRPSGRPDGGKTAKKKVSKTKSAGPVRKTVKKAKTATTKADRPSLAKPTSRATHEMIINVADGVECRIAVLNKGRLEDLYLERQSSESHVGNIYKGRVTNIEPSIQAAFIDFGLPKNGFLHISDLQPQYFPGKSGKLEEVGKKVATVGETRTSIASILSLLTATRRSRMTCNATDSGVLTRPLPVHCGQS